MYSGVLGVRVSYLGHINFLPYMYLYCVCAVWVYVHQMHAGALA